MTKSIQKIIKVGSSSAVTIPAKKMKEEGISVGDEVHVTIEAIKKPSADLANDYEKFTETYGETLKNLAKR